MFKGFYTLIQIFIAMYIPKILFFVLFLLPILVFGQYSEETISKLKKGTSTKADIEGYLGKPLNKEISDEGEVWFYYTIQVDSDKNILSGGKQFKESNSNITAQSVKNRLTIYFNENGVLSKFLLQNNTSGNDNLDDKDLFEKLIQRVLEEKLQGEFKYKGSIVTIGKYENSASQLEGNSAIFLLNQIVWKNYIALFKRNLEFINSTQMFNKIIDLVKIEDPTANSSFVYKELTKWKKICRKGKCWQLIKVNDRTIILIYPQTNSDIIELD
jgi:outer membrane protein assembly factor BamE (lipoprotein component of BamABCDE complex)